MFEVIIKGDDQAALKALQARRIEFALVQSYGMIEVRYSQAFVDDSELEAVKRWFCEPPLVAPAGGFLDGTCLYYGRLPDVRQETTGN